MMLPFLSQRVWYRASKVTGIFPLELCPNWIAILGLPFLLNGGRSVLLGSCCLCRTMSFLGQNISIRRMGYGRRESRIRPFRLSPLRRVRTRRNRERDLTRIARHSSLMNRPWRRQEESNGLNLGIVPGDTLKWTLPILAGVNGLSPPSPLMPTIALEHASSPCQSLWSHQTMPPSRV